MSARVLIEGNGKLDLAEELREEFHAVAEAAVSGAADLLLDEVDRRLALRTGSKSSAAPPGEPPEEDTGRLRKSFRKIPPRVQGAVASSGIRSNDPAGNRLENGFTDKLGIRTFPHPFIRPSIAATEEPITRLLQERLG